MSFGRYAESARKGHLCIRGIVGGGWWSCKVGTASCRASSSSTQEELKASSTALGKEGINGIERVSSMGVGA
jgi:hypothetical protein